MDIASVIIMIAVVWVAYYWGYNNGKKDGNRPLPYRWVCFHEGCEFKCSSDNWELTMKMADKHQELDHG